MSTSTSKHPSLLKLKLNLMARFLLAITIINQSTTARILGDQPPHQQPRLISFFMRSVLDDQLPFPKPAGIFPPTSTARGTGSEYPVPRSDPNPAIETPSMSGMQSPLSFPTVATATLQGLDLGAVTPIEEELVEALEMGLPYKYMGRAKGAYVASSENGNSHMIAMTARFADGEGGGGGGESKDSLRFFGVHRTDVYESHISVIGGTGKYEGANGYATVKAVKMGTVDNRTTTTTATASATAAALLQLSVYLTY